MLAPFDIHEPASVAEAAAMLAHYGYDAAVYAGGTELLLVMKEGLAHYPHLVNIKKIGGLNEVALSADKQALVVGALASHHRLEQDPLVRRHLPLLAEVEGQIANLRVRAAGTLGGNLCFAEPHSDPATLLLALAATVELQNAKERRELPLDQFLTGFFATARQQDELLTQVTIPLLPAAAAAAYERFALHERPAAAVAAFLEMASGVIKGARLALGCLGPAPLLVSEAADLLQGERPSPALFAAAAEAVYRAADPVDDIYGTAVYKRHLARVLATRALRQAAARLNGRRADE
jgi:aerobic carbon-monoxide dehydrogenase medium subunit